MKNYVGKFATALLNDILKNFHGTLKRQNLFINSVSMLILISIVPLHLMIIIIIQRFLSFHFLFG